MRRPRLEKNDYEAIKKLLIEALREKIDFETQYHYVSILSKITK